MTPVTLNAHQVLCEAGEPIEKVYFLRSGFVSLCSVDENGRAVETGSICAHGLVGSDVLLGSTRANVCAIVAFSASEAWGVPTTAFLQGCEACPSLAAFAKHQIRSLLLQAQQNALCHALHSIEARFCRWLLQASNAARTNELDVTQEFCARLLGVQRTSLSITAHQLQQAGYIRTVRGKVRIIDRNQLENIACECYGRHRHTLDQLGWAGSYSAGPNREYDRLLAE
jgi:CRP-like cAMP-binding protein